MKQLVTRLTTAAAACLVIVGGVAVAQSGTGSTGPDTATTTPPAASATPPHGSANTGTQPGTGTNASGSGYGSGSATTTDSSGMDRSGMSGDTSTARAARSDRN